MNECSRYGVGLILMIRRFKGFKQKLILEAEENAPAEQNIEELLSAISDRYLEFKKSLEDMWKI